MWVFSLYIKSFTILRLQKSYVEAYLLVRLFCIKDLNEPFWEPHLDELQPPFFNEAEPLPIFDVPIVQPWVWAVAPRLPQAQ